jgi:hypothetical protein
MRAESERGTCLVICFSPRHDLTISKMSAAQARTVVDLWAERVGDARKVLRVGPGLREPRLGDGRVEPPPARPDLGRQRPPARSREGRREPARHFETTGHSLLLDYAEQEIGGPRDLGSDEDWLVVVPFWAAWPFETLIIPDGPFHACRTWTAASETSSPAGCSVAARLRRACSMPRSRIRWAGIRRRSTASTDRIGSSTPTSIRRSSRRRSGSSWWATSFSPSRSAT